MKWFAVLSRLKEQKLSERLISGVINIHRQQGQSSKFLPTSSISKKITKMFKDKQEKNKKGKDSKVQQLQEDQVKLKRQQLIRQQQQLQVREIW